MKHPLRSVRAITALFLTISAGCGGAREAPARADLPSTASISPAARSVDDPTCRGAGGADRLTIAVGHAVTTRSGIVVRFAGAQHDQYDNGSTDLLLDLELATAGGVALGTWLPSALAPPTYHLVGGQCVRIVDGAPQRVVLDIVAPAEPPPTPSPAPTSTPSTEPAATAPPSSPRVIVTCNDCGVKPIPMIRFQYGSALLPADTEAVLREVAEVMKAHPEITRVAVEGHADLDEGRWIKGDVSRRRAEAVRDQLVAKGVEPGRLTVMAYGSTKPLADNATVAGRARNRRVQFRVEETKQP